MWVDEMEAIQKTAYGFVKLTREDFAKLGIKNEKPVIEKGSEHVSKGRNKPCGT